MKIHITDIPDEGLSFKADSRSDPWCHEVSAQAFESLFSEEPPTEMDVILTRSEDTICLTANIKTVLKPDCDRCLETFEQDWRLHIEQYLIPAPPEDFPPETYESEKELEEEELEYGTYKGKMIDVSEILREEMVLSLPMRFLCGPDCRGLCPHCGINLNKEICQCHEAEHLSPFAVLKSLKT